MHKQIFLAVAAASLMACGGGSDVERPGSETTPASTAKNAGIPASLAPFGDGYPSRGDPCRRLGESAATSNYLDDSQFLIGCPTEEAAGAIPGKIVGSAQGITLVAVPANNPGAPVADRQPAYGFGDAADPETGYHATASIPCGFDGAPPTANCEAGVIRQWGEDGTTLVEVTRPDGRKRALFFRGTTPYGADSAQADGSAGWDFEVSRKDDQTTIEFGPETYIVVDAFVVGG